MCVQHEDNLLSRVPARARVDCTGQRARQDVHGHGQGRVQHRLRGLQNKHGLTCITALCARRSEEHHALDGRARCVCDVCMEIQMQETALLLVLQFLLKMWFLVFDCAVYMGNEGGVGYAPKLDQQCSLPRPTLERGCETSSNIHCWLTLPPAKESSAREL